MDVGRLQSHFGRQSQMVARPVLDAGVNELLHKVLCKASSALLQMLSALRAQKFRVYGTKTIPIISLRRFL